jgi:2-keto-3-deoxy-6-phosphogluconate aldolase
MVLKPLPEKLTALAVMQDAPVIPVIVLNDVNHAVPMARALVAGGIRMLEVTLRTPVALECIERIAKEVPEAVVGAGTMRRRLRREQAPDSQSARVSPPPWGKPAKTSAYHCFPA